LESFRLAFRLKLDSFNFGRLCVYRGTPLWKEYVERGIVDDERDWYKWFKCSDIDPFVLPSKDLNRIRFSPPMVGFKWRKLSRDVINVFFRLK
jgi:hypothetical protein